MSSRRVANSSHLLAIGSLLCLSVPSFVWAPGAAILSYFLRIYWLACNQVLRGRGLSDVEIVEEIYHGLQNTLCNRFYNKLPWLSIIPWVLY